MACVNLTEEISELCRAYRKGSGEERQRLEKRYGRSNIELILRRAEEEVATRRYLKCHSKACPSCRAPIEVSHLAFVTASAECGLCDCRWQVSGNGE